MKKITPLCAVLAGLLLLNACQTATYVPGQKKTAPPGLATMKKHGHKLTPYEILALTGDILHDMGLFGAAAHAAYVDKMNAPNYTKVFVIDHLAINKAGFAEEIKGHVEIPSTYMEFVAKGGLGIPLYEERAPNEFGVVFGRKADIVIRDNVIVRVNPLAYQELYYIKLGSETYDAVMNASIIFQCYEMVRTPYLDNMRIELEGMIMNSESKEAILQDIKKFKAEHRGTYGDDNELLVAYMNANQSYLDELSNSNREALKHIEESKKLLDLIKESGDTAAGNCVKIFSKIALDIAAITAYTVDEAFKNRDQGLAGALLTSLKSATLIAVKTAEYVTKNVPKNSRIKFGDLQNISAYNRYMYNEYSEARKKNNKLEKEADTLLAYINKVEKEKQQTHTGEP